MTNRPSPYGIPWRTGLATLRQSQCQGIKPPMRHCTVEVAFGKLFSYLPLPLQAYPNGFLPNKDIPCPFWRWNIHRIEFMPQSQLKPRRSRSRSPMHHGHSCSASGDPISRPTQIGIEQISRSYLLYSGATACGIACQPLGALFALSWDAKPRTGVNALDTG